MASERVLVFVYGTLKTNQPNHDHIQSGEKSQANLVTKAKTSDKYPLVTGTRYNVPYILKLPGLGHNVIGEIYSVDELMLANLDKLELHPDYYLRQQVSIDGDDGSKCVCWTYFLKEYPEDFLEGRKLLESFEDCAETRYVRPWDRPKTPKARGDLAYRP